MTTTPENASPDEDDVRDDTTAAADPNKEGGAGVEIGMVEGEGSTFEPEEDPEALR
jgi:hypothetical protein